MTDGLQILSPEQNVLCEGNITLEKCFYSFIKKTISVRAVMAFLVQLSEYNWAAQCVIQYWFSS